MRRGAQRLDEVDETELQRLVRDDTQLPRQAPQDPTPLTDHSDEHIS